MFDEIVIWDLMTYCSVLVSATHLKQIWMFLYLNMYLFYRYILP
jgi:hypothetical protein